MTDSPVTPGDPGAVHPAEHEPGTGPDGSAAHADGGEALIDTVLLLQQLERSYQDLRAAHDGVSTQHAHITSLAHGYEALRRHREHLLLVQPVPVVVTDRQGSIRSANAAAAAFLGWRRGQVVGRPLLDLLPAHERRDLLHLVTAGSLPQGAVRRTITFAVKEGEQVTVEATVALLPGEPQALSWMLLTPAPSDHRDILDSLPNTLAKLWALPVMAGEIRSALQEALGIVCGVLGPEVHVSLATGSPLEPTDVVSSSSEAQRIDGAQVAAEEGPCATAYETATVVESDALGVDERWPHLRQRLAAGSSADSTQQLAAVAVPLTFGGAPVGALNVYCLPHRLDAGLVQACELFGATIAAVVYEVTAKAELAALAAGLEQAMASRAVIEQAKGIVMAARQCDADEAFRHLVHLSSTQHMKLRELANQIVSNVGGSQG